MSIRGEIPKGYYKQITLTLNPWSAKHWIKKRFFDVQDEDILALTTTYKCNEWLSEEDIKLFEKMKVNNPKRYLIEGEGQWGVSDGLVYQNWIESEFNIEDLKGNGYQAVFGLDFGYINDPSAFIASIIDKENEIIYIYDEHYQKGMSNKMIADMIKYKGYSKEIITADSAEPKSIDELRSLGVRRIQAAAKGKDSILNGIQFIQNFKIVVNPKCENTIIELSNYIWDKKDERTINKPIDDYNHLLDALRYSLERIRKPKGLSILK